MRGCLKRATPFQAAFNRVNEVVFISGSLYNARFCVW